MDEKLLAVLLGVVTGTLGYWFTTFWMKPILRYRELRTAIFADLIYYAQVPNADGLNERMQKLFESRILGNRRHAADLQACLLELPNWYKWLLARLGHAPEAAVTHLIGYSNTTEYEGAAKRVVAIKTALGIKSDIV